MKSSEGSRAKLGALVLVAAMTAAAMLALPGLVSGKGHPPRGGEPAGTVESFDPETGELVIDLAKGGTISGLVNRRTHIRCGDHGERRHGFGRGDDSASASDSGPGDDAGPPEGEGEGRGPNGDRPRGPRGDDSPGDDDDRGERCREQLVPGAVVRGAVVVLIDGGAFYKDVGLVPQDDDDETPAPTS